MFLWVQTSCPVGICEKIWELYNVKSDESLGKFFCRASRESLSLSHSLSFSLSHSLSLSPIRVVCDYFSLYKRFPVTLPQIHQHAGPHQEQTQQCRGDHGPGKQSKQAKTLIRKEHFLVEPHVLMTLYTAHLLIYAPANLNTWLSEIYLVNFFDKDTNFASFAELDFDSIRSFEYS